MTKFRIFISSVQREFADERRMLAEYIRTDALLGRFFDVFLFEESIVRRCLEVGLPKPEYHPDNVDFKTVIWRNPARLNSDNVRSGPSRGPAGAQSGPSRGPVKDQPHAHASTVGRETCVELLRNCVMSRKELALRLNLSPKSGFIKRFLAELLDDGLVELTIPGKPNSRLQKYRLTDKGRRILSVHG